MEVLTSQSAETLARRAQAGSAAAFEELVGRFGLPVLRYLQGKAGNNHDAEDLRQETFLRAYKNLHRYDPERPFSPWLFTIAARLAVTHLRSRHETARIDVLEIPSAGAGPREASAVRDLQSTVWSAAADTLPASQYEALWLRYGQDMPVKDVARVMGITGTHARVLLHRARKRLVMTGALEHVRDGHTGKPARTHGKRGAR